jgi:hypothetical protein
MTEAEQLSELRSALLRLHKKLLDVERKDFEKTFGRLTSGELLQLVVNHAQFAWLRKISGLIVQIDESLDSEDADIAALLRQMVDELRILFDLSANTDFMTKYQSALQREPEVVVAHSELMTLLRD